MLTTGLAIKLQLKAVRVVCSPICEHRVSRHQSVAAIGHFKSIQLNKFLPEQEGSGESSPDRGRVLLSRGTRDTREQLGIACAVRREREECSERKWTRTHTAICRNDRRGLDSRLSLSFP